MALLSKRHLLGAALALTAWAAAALAAPAEAPPLEYQVKASYLYNFVRFVTWPNDAFRGEPKFNFCVVGAERFGSALDSIAGERVDGHEIMVRRLKTPAQAREARCHLLFVAAGVSDPADMSPARGVLTVGETTGFLKQGGVISLLDANGRIRFQINQQAARDAGLTISSRLLDLAQKQL